MKRSPSGSVFSCVKLPSVPSNLSTLYYLSGSKNWRGVVMQAVKNNIRQRFLSLLIVTLCWPVMGLCSDDRSDLANKWIRQIHDEGAAGLAILLRAKAEVDTGELTLNNQESVKKLLLATECAAHALEEDFILDRLTLAARAFSEKKHQSRAYLEACKKYREAIVAHRVPFREYEREYQIRKSMDDRRYIDDLIQRYQQSSAEVYPRVLVMIECCGVEPEQRVYDKTLEHRVAVLCIVNEECEQLKAILNMPGDALTPNENKQNALKVFISKPVVRTYFTAAAPGIYKLLEAGRLDDLAQKIAALQSVQAGDNLQSYVELAVLGSQPFSSLRWAEMGVPELIAAQLKQRTYLHSHYDDWGLLQAAR
ncbi:hypothetical protein ACWJJH_12770 [Endozoicomonadaceae bacterium StTr2]